MFCDDGQKCRVDFEATVEEWFDERKAYFSYLCDLMFVHDVFNPNFSRNDYASMKKFDCDIVASCRKFEGRKENV